MATEPTLSVNALAESQSVENHFIHFVFLQTESRMVIIRLNNSAPLLNLGKLSVLQVHDCETPA